MDSLHLITVRERAGVEVQASGAKLTVRIAGQSFFTGNEAFTKATEVATFVAALEELGMTRDGIQLLNVSTEVESGILTKTSSATYHLLIDCETLDLLGRVLATVSSQKNSVLAAISWQYEDIDKTKIELVETAVRTSKESAAIIANSLDVPLLGVHKLSYEISGLDNEQRVPEVYAYATRSRKAKSSALESLDLSHTATVLATVTAEFMIDKFTQIDRNEN